METLLGENSHTRTECKLQSTASTNGLTHGRTGTRRRCGAERGDAVILYRDGTRMDGVKSMEALSDKRSDARTDRNIEMR